MERIEEFTQNGRNFIYLDFSGFVTNDEFIKFVEEAKPIIKKNAENSLYTITNMEGVRFDTKTKKIITEWTTHNIPYVRYGAVIGIDAVKKIMANAIINLSGRKNLHTASSKEEAVEWLLKQK